jgi:hypothetical protein
MTTPIQGLLLDTRPTIRMAEFAEVLRRAGGWILARQVLIQSGLVPDEGHKRWLRGLAAGSQLILSGQRGYCHLENASVEELHHAAAWLESQARQMQRRAIHLRQAAIRKIAA